MPDDTRRYHVRIFRLYRIPFQLALLWLLTIRLVLLWVCCLLRLRVPLAIVRKPSAITPNSLDGSAGDRNNGSGHVDHQREGLTQDTIIESSMPTWPQALQTDLGTLGESSTSLHQIALAMATQSEAIKAMERSELAEEEISAPVLQASLPSEDTRNLETALPTTTLLHASNSDADAVLHHGASQLDVDIHHLEHQLRIQHPNDPDRPYMFLDLGSLLDTRFIRHGMISDLEQAVTAQREALLLCPIGHPDRSCSLNNLAGAIQKRFNYKGEMRDLDEAIALHREALCLHQVGHPNRSASLNNLAAVIGTRFEQKGDMADMDEAIVLDREALLLRPIGHPNRFSSLNNLATAITRRFQQRSDMADLDEAIGLHREALLLYPMGHPNRSKSLNNLAGAVQLRFEQKSDMADLDEAIALHQEALRLRPMGHPSRSVSLCNLASAVWARFQHKGGTEDLGVAIELFREALFLRPVGHPDRSGILTNLGNAVLTQFENNGEIKDLEEAITMHREALSLHPIGHHHRSASLNNLANTIWTRFTHLGGMGDLQEAIMLHGDALLLHPLGHPDRSASLWALGVLILFTYNALLDGSLQNSDLDADHLLITAHAMFKEGANMPATAVAHRLHASFRWCEVSRRVAPDSAVDAYIHTFSLLDTALAHATSLETRHTRLSANHLLRRSDLADLATDATSCAIDQDKIEQAVELLEQGRATILTQIGRYRTPLDDVAALDAELADDFRRLSRQLDASIVKGDEMTGAPELLQDNVARYYRTVTQWDAVVERIRALDGFRSFLRPTPFVELQRAAANGPVIIVNINKHRSDAIIVFNELSPCLVPLPAATPSAVQQLSDELARQATDPDSQQAVVPILRTIWDKLVGPIADKLQLVLPPGSGSRIWWCPTASATRLPLHAAGEYRKGGRSLPDMYISSYTPTLGALIRARKTSKDVVPPATPSMLLVGQPETPGEEPLPAVSDEIGCVSEHAPHATLLEGSLGTRNAVLGGLARHSWAHLACHGHQLEKPFESHFSLHDGHLRMIDIIETRLDHAELAVLSACHSAAGDKATPDETLHLTAAMQFAGFRSVVGTMWAMVDEDGPVLMEAFYEEMLGGEGKVAECTNAAAALSKAVKVLRRNKVPASRWINFVHYGA